MIEFQPGKYRRKIVRLWWGTGWFLGFFVVYLIAVRINFLWLFGGMPDLATLENPKSELASELISEDGQSLGKYFVMNRTPIEYSQLSPHVVEALVATEDARFLHHSGIDARSLFRVGAGIITANSGAGGGSTITQQVAKNLFETRTQKNRGLLGGLPGVKIVIAKTKEWMLAIILERKYTKQEIMMMYLNTVSFGNNTYGIKVAAKTYFNVDSRDLTVPQAAMLVGMLQNPSLFNPLRFPERTGGRRNTVLAQMNKYAYLSSEDFSKYRAAPLQLRYTIESHISGAAPYFQESMRGFLKAWVQDYNEENDAELNLNTSGLKIYTTIDSRMQRYQEQALTEHMKQQQRLFEEHWKGRNPWIDDQGREMPGFIEKAVNRLPHFNAMKTLLGKEAAWKIINRPYKMKVFSWEGEREVTMSPVDSLRYYKRFLHAGMMSMDPRNGHIKAWVGGLDFKYFKYDHVKQGRRQPGSTFKPFVYVAGLDKNFITLCDRVVDQPVTFGAADGVSEGYTPKNSNGDYSYQSLSLRQALGKSVNSVSAYIIKMVKAKTVAEYAHKLGITSPLPETPALALGTGDVSVYEMVNAYSSFVNGGYRTEPMTILRIEDRHGNILREFHQKQNQELNENMAYGMLYLMRGAVEDPGGTAGRLSSYGVTQGNEIAAKTGTSQHHSDGWFMGMTQNLVTGLWVGGEDRSIHFRTLALGQGGRVAMPAWGLFMQKVYSDPALTDYQKEPFKKPEGYVRDCGNVSKDSTNTYIPPSGLDDEGVLF
jgi:penicillin-binding protein 1A